MGWMEEWRDECGRSLGKGRKWEEEEYVGKYGKEEVGKGKVVKVDLLGYEEWEERMDLIA